MLPPSGASVPAIWLISVVLPAPFGPMMAWSSPGITSSVTPSVTSNPPKRLLRFSSRRMGSVTAPSRNPRGQTNQPAARKHHNKDQQRTEDHLPVLGEPGEPFLRKNERRSADDRAV